MVVTIVDGTPMHFILADFMAIQLANSKKKFHKSIDANIKDGGILNQLPDKTGGNDFNLGKLSLFKFALHNEVQNKKY